jgi:hypothetical protein
VVLTPIPAISWSEMTMPIHSITYMSKCPKTVSEEDIQLSLLEGVGATKFRVYPAICLGIVW